MSTGRPPEAKAAPIGAILSDFAKEDGPETYRDEQRLSIAGIVASSKTKTTKNNTLMAYVTLEDDTGAMELLVFARVLGESGGYIKENAPVLGHRAAVGPRREGAPDAGRQYPPAGRGRDGR